MAGYTERQRIADDLVPYPKMLPQLFYKLCRRFLVGGMCHLNMNIVHIIQTAETLLNICLHRCDHFGYPLLLGAGNRKSI